MPDAIVRAVAGLRGYGKTTRVLELARNEPRVLFFDSLGDDYSEGVVCRNRDVLEKLWRASYRGRFRISYKPVDPMEDLPRVCVLAYECGHMLLVVDEVQLYFRGQWCAPELTKIITAGRHADVGLIGVTQAPKRLGELLRSQAHEWFVFATREPGHVKYLAERLAGVDPDDIVGLAKYEYIHYIDGADGYERCVDDLATHTTRAERIAFTGASDSGSENETSQAAPAGNPSVG